MLLIASLCLPMAGFAEDDSSQITSAKIVPVRVMNTPLQTEVVKEPAAPRDVNVVNAVNVAASQPLPVATSSYGGEVSFFVQQTGPDPVAILGVDPYVPAGKKFIITAVKLVMHSGQGDYAEILTGAEPRVRFILSDTNVNFGSGVVFNAGETPGLRIHCGWTANYAATIMGRMVDAE